MSIVTYDEQIPFLILSNGYVANLAQVPRLPEAGPPFGEALPPASGGRAAREAPAGEGLVSLTKPPDGIGGPKVPDAKHPPIRIPESPNEAALCST
ncbi:hypothetical protein PCANC_02696 [Puccinia coronata f. sp. avenae]|uniref:Uncharacterized protein n=1 Tax=Puccinia coronata f. sp. avenae TaxID=200324 RepID=A0A2N5TPV2_9BASI|nr:hypothetical protein PCASD_16270 [Puccinia coronata f. sp. avenae]PLW27536.1 hypothetical protein PCASD_16267 [Puccinia coronata f. sp. avenae]PLW54943.1 hypothetical protein PCANC_02705 [Puccinia coronata f. sp. avenae]PLW54944.1 hypothetical protein PCANC_02702 [Puccinia coronata f. sp. avenae]PLW54955.1 hypothetical protein PCANC_02699 [Puccinia coronata f. sp. avenae]